MSRHLCRQAPLRALFASALACLTLADPGRSADQTATWNNSTGNWSDATRWSTNPLFPNNGNGGFTFDAIINGGTATLNQDITIEALSLGGGNIAGGAATNFTLTLNDLLTWTSGTIGGPGTVDANGGITMSGTFSKTLGSGGNAGRTLVNDGTANLTGGSLLISSSGGANPGSLFQNNVTFNVTGESDISNNNFGGNAGRFNNAGTFNKSGVGTTTTISAQFNNSGTVNVDEGTLELSSGGGTSIGGTFAVDAGAILRFTSGTHTVDSASTITGAGDVTFDGNTVNIDGTYTITGITTVSGGTVNFNTPAATLTTLNLSSGTLGGSGSQNVSGAFNWTAGVLANNGTTTIDNTATLTMSGTANKTLGNGGNAGRTLVNNGVANLSGGNLLISSSGGVNPGSLFQNNVTFNVTGESDISHNNFGGSAGRFNNAGTFNKSGVGTTTTISPQFNNTGTVNVDQGILELSGSSTSTGGTIAVDAGAILRFSSGNHTFDNASTIIGAGDVDFSTNTVTLDGTYAITGITTVSGGTVNFNAPAATLTTLNLSSGTLGGSGSQNVTTAFNWTGGTLANSGTTTVDNTATLTMSGTGAKTLGNGGNAGRTLVNNGTANFSGGNLNISSSGGANPGSLFQNNGTFNALDNADIANNNFGGPAGRFTNAGTFNKSGVGTTTNVSALFNNTGTVNIDEGELGLSGGGTSTGGTMAVDTGATLRFNGGTFTLDAASSTTGAGDVTFDSGTINLDGTYTVTGITTVSGATANFNTPAATLTTLNFSSGTLGGSGSQNITGAFNWTGGQLANTGTTTVDNTATLTISGTSTSKPLGNGGNAARTLVNNGVTNLSGATLSISSSGGANPGSLFRNNGTFNVTDEADISNNNFGGSAGRFENAGTLNKTGAGTTTAVSTIFTNTGTINVNEGTLSVSGPFTNYDAASDTLTGGTYNVTSNFRFLNADINTNRASITLNGPASQISDQGGAVNALADFALNDTGAFFGIVNNRDFTTTATFMNRGDVQIGGGTFNAAGIFNESAGEFFGFGTIADAITNSGTVRASGGTLTMGGTIGGPAGTIQVDPGASLDLSGAGGQSNADFLVHNGDGLNLGANNIIVRQDYTNANFGAGNSFNPRANVIGAGQIIGDGGTAQTISGEVSNGATPTAMMNFGNIHVGDIVTRNYQIANAGPATAARLRGAIQTAANGGNITDSRLSGPGVTAANFGPISGQANSGNLGVTFTGTSAGQISGQQVRIINNFDNVGDQLLEFNGAAYRLANPTPHIPEPINFGNVHVGVGAPMQAIGITNNVPADGFSESLEWSFGGTTGGVFANGSFTSLAPGQTSNSDLIVGIDTSTAGNKSGTATINLTSNGNGSSNLGLTSLPSQTVNVTGSVYRLASASPHSPEPVDFGIVHVGDTPQQALTISNTAPADGFSESLDAAIGSPTGNATTNSGSFTGLTPGSTNSTNLVVGVDTSTAGAKSGTATIALTSNGAGSSGLGSTELPSQIVNVQAQVNNFAVADVAKLAGDGTFTMTGANEFTLNFGTIIQGQPSRQAELGIINDVLAPADDLAGSFTLAAPDFMLTGFDPFSDDDHEAITAGSTRSGLLVELDADTVGMFSGQITLNPRSINSRPFSMDLAPITILLRGEIQPVPEPATITLLIALLAFPAIRRR